MINAQRLLAVMSKEFIQMIRDKATFGMLLGIPCIQLILFGFAINVNPKNLPVAIVSADHSAFTRRFITAMENTDYFRFVQLSTTEKTANRLLKEGRVQFVVTIPPNFTRDLVRGERPSILLEADATDPAATGNAVSAVQQLAGQVFEHELRGSLAYLQATPPAMKVVLHTKYNPLQITQYNIVPGLLGVILTMTLVMVTSIALTRERERGTLENLLATPVRPLEVIIGKAVPYIIVGYIQAAVILLASRYIFQVPIVGSVTLLLFACLPFIFASLAVGVMFSTFAKTQLQAVQSSTFFFLPSILLSGFMFPFRGMPEWAQWIGSILPLTHFLAIVRGVMLKGSHFSDIWHSLWPILLFLVITITIAVKRYRQTLD